MKKWIWTAEEFALVNKALLTNKGIFPVKNKAVETIKVEFVSKVSTFALRSPLYLAGYNYNVEKKRYRYINFSIDNDNNVVCEYGIDWIAAGRKLTPEAVIKAHNQSFKKLTPQNMFFIEEEREARLYEPA